MTKSKLESEIVAAAHEYAKLRGWFTFKVESPTFNGLPDRCYIRRGEHVWIEWKKPGGVLASIQIKRINDMREHGATVYVLDNMDDFKRIMR